VAFASVTTAAAMQAVRLRRRARWVRRLEELMRARPGLVGELFRGRWTPDLPSAQRTFRANMVLSAFPRGAKLLGGGAAQAKTPSDGIFFVVEDERGVVHVVYPTLLSKLSRYSVFRPRDAWLLDALRSRALDWVKEVNLEPEAAPGAVASAIWLASLETPSELASVEAALDTGYTALLGERP
jgi:hypothetical protein